MDGTVTWEKLTVLATLIVAVAGIAGFLGYRWGWFERRVNDC